MTTIICPQCAHIVLVQPDGLGYCVHCGAGYKVTIEQVRESPLRRWDEWKFTKGE